MAFVRDPNCLTPIMTSNTTPQGCVFADSDIEFAYKCMNGGDSENIWRGSIIGNTFVLGYDFGKPTIVTYYNLDCSTQASTATPKNWKLEGWTGNAWVELDSRSNIIEWTASMSKRFIISNPSAYSKYQLRCTSSNHGSYVYLSELELCGGTPPFPQPIHRWRLDKDATDSVGGLVTTNNGEVTFDSVKGARFNGKDQWLSFVKTLPNIFSINLWVAFDSTIGDYRMMGTGSSPSITGFYYYSPLISSFMLNDIQVYSNNDFSAQNYPKDVLVMCTIVNDGTNITLYRASIPIATKLRTGSPVSFNWSIGRHGSISSQALIGNIADVRIYNVALTQSDLSNLVSQGPNGDITKILQRPQAIGGF